MPGAKATQRSEATPPLRPYRVLAQRVQGAPASEVQVSMTALRAFEAVARLSRVTRAAEELGRTQGAVSRQIAHLEDQLGVQLFTRTRQQLTLNNIGREFLSDVEEILDKVSESTRKIIARQQNPGKITLALSPCFAPQWLMARFGAFAKRNPEIRLDLTTRKAPFDFLSEQIDVAIIYGRVPWTDAIIEPLTHANLIAVGNPHLPISGNPDEPGTWRGLPLLQRTGAGSLWNTWFKQLGADPSHKHVTAEFEHMSMLVEAATVGLGVALVPEFIVADKLKTGALVQISSLYIRDPDQFFIAYAQANADNPDISAFCEWIRGEAREDSCDNVQRLKSAR